MKKRLLSFFVFCLAICLSLFFVSCGNNTDESVRFEDIENVQELAFFLQDDGTYAVSGGNAKYLSSITIPSTHKSIPVTKILDNAFEGFSIVNIDIPDKVTNIGIDAFSNCDELTNIYYNGTTIEWSQIDGLGNLMSSYRTLYIDNEKVTEVNLENITEIKPYAFCGCSGLTSVTIPDSVTIIGGYAFYGCSRLTSITIPDRVTSIENYAFYGSGLTSVTIGGGVTRIGNYAFNNCLKLFEIYNKSRLNIVKGESGFGQVGYCAKNIYTPTEGESKLHYNTDGCIIYNDAEEKILLGYVGSKTELDLSEHITVIYPNAFVGCSELTSIIIGKDVTSIGESAFSNCSSLTSATILGKVTSIGEKAFYNCSNLTSIIFGDSVTSIGYSAIAYCGALTSITVSEGNAKYRSENNCLIEKSTNTLILGCKNSVIPDSVTSIGDAAFYYCSGLINITIPDSVTSIGNSAFYGCNELKSIIISDSVTNIGDFAFFKCRELKTVYYCGNSNKWSEITIKENYSYSFNDDLYFTRATRYYYSESEPPINAQGTAYNDNYWHYAADGKTPVFWVKEN